jgi:alkanesulfonate monooxygenase SsuD/methylene tetrahydromethanopterin reductase-like flavin-dependent oxidoreductase (luciferase family)
LAADTEAEANDQLVRTTRARVARFLAGGRDLTDAEADDVVASPQGQQVVGMMRYRAVGDPAAVKDYLLGFAAHAEADELIVAHGAPTLAERLRSVELLADVAALQPV